MGLRGGTPWGYFWNVDICQAFGHLAKLRAPQSCPKDRHSKTLSGQVAHCQSSRWIRIACSCQSLVLEMVMCQADVTTDLSNVNIATACCRR
ncbi:hypothetical protein WJX74_004702 [Apatococcus lobatus]|uniref:Uncharacterized protein n=1 Tax=Apatococcus lobatus TaxID=904363 RepID=A0AAW1QHA3_9CHLO